MKTSLPKSQPKPVAVAPDLSHLSLAARAARFWLGATSPNPAVGCAGTDIDGNILAVAAHHKAGEGHAEANLIAQCRINNTLHKLHTLYVTLEPCNHHGRTPPCSEAILSTPAQRVIIGALDPNPAVAGGGLARLRGAGIDAQYIPNAECDWLLLPFANSVTRGKPLITVKRAFDEHGSMSPPKGQKTFTSASSLKLAHQLRKKADAIVTGSGTILADNPAFTVRHVPDHVGKQRILAILNRRRRVPETYLANARLRNLTPVIYDDLNMMWDDFYQRGMRDVLVEAGEELSATILKQGNWNIQVDIHKTSSTDRITTKFNLSPKSPDPNSFDWQWFLPEEHNYET